MANLQLLSNLHVGVEVSRCQFVQHPAPGTHQTRELQAAPVVLAELAHVQNHVADLLSGNGNLHLEAATILAIWAITGPCLDGIFLGQVKDILLGRIEFIANLSC